METKEFTIPLNNKDKVITAYPLSAARLFIQEQIAKQPFIGRVQISESWADLLYIDIQQSWGIGCSFTFKLKTNFDPNVPLTYDQVVFSWSSTERDLSSAIAALALYEQVVKFAAQIERIMTNEWRYFYEDEG